MVVRQLHDLVAHGFNPCNTANFHVVIAFAKLMQKIIRYLLKEDLIVKQPMSQEEREEPAARVNRKRMPFEISKK